MRGGLGFWLRLLFSISLLGYLAYLYPLPAGREWSSFPVWLLPGLFTLGVCQIELAGYRWFYVLKALGIQAEKARVRQLTWISTLSNTFLPSTLPGELQKFWGLKNAGARSSLVKALVMDRVVVHGSWLWAFAIVVWQPMPPEGAVWGMIAVLGGGGAGLILWWILTWAKIWGRALWASLGVSFLIPLALYGVSLGLQTPFEFSALIWITPFLLGGYAIPFTIAGFGSREALLVAFASSLGVTPSEALLVSLVTGGGLALPALLGLWVKKNTGS